jgi:hypothetical protein
MYLKAIREKCKDCTNNQLEEIKKCTITKCALYPHRIGHKKEKDDGTL